MDRAAAETAVPVRNIDGIDQPALNRQGPPQGGRGGPRGRR